MAKLNICTSSTQYFSALVYLRYIHIQQKKKQFYRRDYRPLANYNTSSKEKQKCWQCLRFRLLTAIKLWQHIKINRKFNTFRKYINNKLRKINKKCSTHYYYLCIRKQAAVYNVTRAHNLNNGSCISAKPEKKRSTAIRWSQNQHVLFVFLGINIFTILALNLVLCNV